jgi:hypothetical protein
MSSVPVLKIPFCGAPLVMTPLVIGAIPRDGVSITDNVLMNLFAITVSNGPSAAASLFSPAVCVAPFDSVRLFVFP